MKDNGTLKIDGKSLSFKESDIKLFGKLKNSIEGVERTLRESGKIPDSRMNRFATDMTEGYLSVMLIIHGLNSTLDLKHHSVRRVTNVSRTVENNLVDTFLATGATARAQLWLAWEVMSVYNEFVLHHNRLMKRLNGTTISALRRAVHDLEGRREEVNNFDDYLIEIVMPARQVEENAYVLLEESDILMLKEYQISQLRQMLRRVKTLLEWRCPQS